MSHWIYVNPGYKRNTKSESQRENIEEIEDEIQNLNVEETQNFKKKQLWDIKRVKEAQDFDAPYRIVRESKRLKRVLSYTKTWMSCLN